MVKIIKLFCILAIIALLVLFISYTETNRHADDERISEISNEEQTDAQSLKSSTGDPKSNLNSIFYFIML
ncbi:MAG: hypothetical protein P1P88_14720 [Bacteroidales bacterium]|nr:hypothetical protein [Bacteroidales bacterium]